MQISTNIKKQVDEIKELDSKAKSQSEAVKGQMVEALRTAILAGEKLEAMKHQHGSRNFKQILKLNFEEGFEDRAKRYQVVYKKHDDPRQCMLALGVMPEKEKRGQDPTIKLNSLFVWISKINGQMTKPEELNKSAVIALRGMVRKIAIALEKFDYQ